MKTYDLVFREKEVIKEGRFDGYKLTFEFGNGSTMEKRVFRNDKKYGAVVEKLQPGNKVKVTIDDTSRYKNITDLEILESSAGRATGGAADGRRNGAQRKANAGAEFRTPIEITRTEALKLAIDLVDKKLAPDDMEAIVTKMANDFVAFITNKRTPPQSDPGGAPGWEPGDETGTEDGSQDDEIPF